MPVELSWYQADHIILARFVGDVTIDDLIMQYKDGKVMSESVSTPTVHLIADTRDVTSFPTNFKAYQHAFGEKSHNAGWVLLVGDNKLARFLSTLVTTVMKVRFAYVPSLEDAVIFLRDRDRSLSEVSRIE